MSIRIESNGFMTVNGGTVQMEDVSVYVTRREDVLKLDSSRFLMGSVLYIIREGATYILDDDGARGVWCAADDGHVLALGGDEA